MVYYNYYYVPASGESDLNPCELECLKEFLLKHPFEYYVEVGVGYLGTLCYLAQTIVENKINCKCIGIDAFGELPRDSVGSNSHQGDVIRLEDAENLLIHRQLDKTVTLYRGDSAAVLRDVLKPIKNANKLIFIDGNHTYEGCREDFKAVDTYAAAHDILVFHDALKFQHSDYGCGPRGVIENYLVDNPRYNCLRIPPPHLKLSNVVNTTAIFQVQ